MAPYVCRHLTIMPTLRGSLRSYWKFGSIHKGKYKLYTMSLYTVELLFSFTVIKRFKRRIQIQNHKWSPWKHFAKVGVEEYEQPTLLTSTPLNL